MKEFLILCHTIQCNHITFCTHALLCSLTENWGMICAFQWPSAMKMAKLYMYSLHFEKNVFQVSRLQHWLGFQCRWIEWSASILFILLSATGPEYMVSDQYQEQSMYSYQKYIRPTISMHQKHKKYKNRLASMPYKLIRANGKQYDGSKLPGSVYIVLKCASVLHCFQLHNYLVLLVLLKFVLAIILIFLLHSMSPARLTWYLRVPPGGANGR